MQLAPLTQERLFGYQHAFEHTITTWITIGLCALLLLSFSICYLLNKAGKLSESTATELYLRNKTWAILLPALLLPILGGAFWTILGILVLGLWCYKEYARATGLFREYLTSATVVLVTTAIAFAALDHWYGLFVALSALGTAAIAGINLFSDKPQGYIQRTALAIFAFMFFGFGLGHLSYLTNMPNYRPVLLLLILTVQLNDVAAFIWGKLFGHRKIAPNTSPGKTLAGSLGALGSTTLLVSLLGPFVFENSPLDNTSILIGLGVLISLTGQMGDLMISSIKRDLGIKDIDNTLPGHGGLLDRFDSLLLAAPAVFHYIGYFHGVGLDQPTRIFSGG